jgi:MFS family permease
VGSPDIAQDQPLAFASTHPEQTVRRASVVLALLVGAQFVIILDASIVNVALPSIQRSFHIHNANLQNVVTAYAVAFGAPLILAGRLSDLFGRRRTFRVALVGFGATSLLCGFASSGPLLIGARALQGLSASLLAPSALALLVGTFWHERERVHALSRFGAATVLGSLSGLVVGGVLVTLAGWRSVFFVNAPITLTMVILAGRLLPPDDGHDVALTSRRARLRQLDFGGAVLAVASLSDIVLALNLGASRGWISTQFLVPMGIGLALALGFIAVELRVQDPLLRIGLLRIDTVRWGNVLIFMFGVLVGAGGLTMGLYLQKVLHYTPLKAGMALVPQGVVSYAFSRLSSRLFTSLRIRWVLCVSYGIVGITMGVLSTLMSTHQSYLVLLPLLVILGGSQVVSTVGATISTSLGVPINELGVAGAIRQTSFQVGLAIGVAVFASLAAFRTHGLIARGVAGVSALSSGYQLAFEGLAVVGLLGSAAALIGLRNDRAARAGLQEGASE